MKQVFTRRAVYGLSILFIVFSLVRSVQARVLLRNNIRIHSTPYFENTAKVVPPNAGCPRGKIVVSTGQPRNTAKLLHRPLYDQSGNIDTTSATAEVAYPTGSTKAIATDNQIIRLPDGSLLAIKDAYIWDTIGTNPPPWINETVTGSGDRKGQRAGVLLFHSTDCGTSWTLHSTIDFATLLGGKYGVPRPMDNSGNTDVPESQQGKYPDGSRRWWVGGPDRTEIYACPFTKHLYVTTRVISGPYKSATVTLPQQNTALLLYSKDNGKTWEAVKEDLPAWSPIVMTSTRNGRLFLFHLIGSAPTIYFSKAPVTPGIKPQMSQGYPVYAVENGVNVQNATVNGSMVDLFLQLFHPSVSRVSTDTASSKVRAAYHAVNTNGMQETRVITIDVQDPNKAPVVTPVRTVRAQNPKDYSVLYFTFIDPDYVDLSVAAPSNISGAYWIEAPRVGLTDKKYAVRGMFFEGDYNSSCPAALSVQDDQPRTWSTRQDLGDYMSGGFFWKDNNLNYLAQWVEPTGIVANVATVPYRGPSGNPTTTLAAVWQPDTQDEVQVYDWKYSDFRKRYDELWPLGWRLHLLENRVVGGEVLYTAVWHRSTSPEIQVYGWTYQDFRKKYDELWPQGWRLHILSTVVVQGDVRYTAVWRPSTAEEIQVYGWAYRDFRNKYDELWPQGWRLFLLENFVLNNQVLYTAVWRRSTSAEIQVYGWAYRDFRNKYDELWPQGWRLYLLNTVMVNGEPRYTAVWRPSTSGEIQVYGWAYADFKRKYDEFFCDGWRLKLLNVY